MVGESMDLGRDAQPGRDDLKVRYETLKRRAEVRNFLCRKFCRAVESTDDASLRRPRGAQRCKLRRRDVPLQRVTNNGAAHCNAMALSALETTTVVRHRAHAHVLQ